MSYERVEKDNQQRLKIPTPAKVMSSKPLVQEFPKLIKNGKSQEVKEAKESVAKVKKVVIKVKDQDQTLESFNLSNGTFMKNFDTCIQSGYRTLKTFEAQKAAEWKEMPKIGTSQEKYTEVETDKINEYKQTFRSGYQAKNTSNMVSDLQITMGVKEPFLVKNGKCLGSIARDNGWSGIIKEDIQMKYR